MMRQLVILLFVIGILGCNQTDPQQDSEVAEERSSVFVGTLESVDKVDIENDPTLLQAILQHQGLGEFEAKSESPLPAMVMVRRGLPNNEERIVLPMKFVQNSLGGKFQLGDGDLVVLVDALDCSAFSLGAPEAGKNFSVKGLVNRSGEFQSGVAGSKIEDIRTDAFAGKSTRQEGSFDLLVHQTIATDGVKETYLLPLERPFFQKLYLKIRIKDGDVVEFVDGKAYFQR